MTHAFLLTAYNDFDLLEKNIRLYASLGDVYVHIDKKSDGAADFGKRFANSNNIFVFSRYKIYWASYKHLSAFLFLLKKALAQKSGGYDFYHFLAGNTFPAADGETIRAFFESNRNKNFMEVLPVDGRIAERYRYRYFLHLYDGKSEKGRRLTAKLLSFQKKFHIESSRSYAFRGYVYCHLNKETVSEMTDYLSAHRDYFKKLKTCLIPEEFFFQNLVMNGSHAGEVVNDSLIFDKWIGNSGSPLLLTEEHWQEILSSRKLFCRKIGRGSENLAEKICRLYDSGDEIC